MPDLVICFKCESIHLDLFYGDSSTRYHWCATDWRDLQNRTEQIAKLERHKTKEGPNTCTEPQQTMGAAINNDSTTTGPPLSRVLEGIQVVAVSIEHHYMNRLKESESTVLLGPKRIYPKVTD